MGDVVRSEDEILKRIQSTDGGGDDVADGSALGSRNVFGHDVSGGDGRNVCDEGVNHGESGSDNELGDLHASQGALHDVGDPDGKGRQSVVSVLKRLISKQKRCRGGGNKLKLTIKAWIKELKRQKIQMGLAM